MVEPEGITMNNANQQGSAAEYQEAVRLHSH
jgi:hypothetical protein